MASQEPNKGRFFADFPDDGLAHGGLAGARGHDVAGPGQEKEHDPEGHEDTEPRQDKHQGKAPGLGHEAPGCRPQAHADIERRGVPAIGPAEVGGRRDAGHIRHGGGAEGGQPGAGKQVDPDELVRRRTDGQEKGRGGQDQQSHPGQKLHAQAVDDQTQGQGQGPGGQQEGAVDQAHHNRIGAQSLGVEGHHREAHVGAEVAPEDHPAADQQQDGITGSGDRFGIHGGQGLPLARVKKAPVAGSRLEDQVRPRLRNRRQAGGMTTGTRLRLSGQEWSSSGAR